MLGIVIVAHGTLAQGFKSAANVIMGEVNNIETIGLSASQNIEELEFLITQSINKIYNDKGIIVLTDLIGASPYNQSMIAISKLPLEKSKNIYLIGGINMSLLLEAIENQINENNVLDYIKNLSDIEYWNISKRHIKNKEDDF